MSATCEKFTPEKTILFPKEVRFHPELSFGEKVFLAEIQSKTEKGEPLYFSSRKLGEIFNVSNQTIMNWSKKLRKLGLIEIEHDFEESWNKMVIKSTSRT